LVFKEIVSKIPKEKIVSKLSWLITKISEDKIVSKVPMAFQAFMFMANSKKITDNSDPFIASIAGVAYLGKVCSPQFPYPIKCCVLASQTAFTIKSKGGDVSLTLLFAVANQILRVEDL